MSLGVSVTGNKSLSNAIGQIHFIPFIRKSEEKEAKLNRNTARSIAILSKGGKKWEK